MKQDLTEIQASVAKFMVAYWRDAGEVPTCETIAEHFKWASKNAARANIQALLRKGWLEKLPYNPRRVRFPGLEHSGVESLIEQIDQSPKARSTK
jgi:SOS-response transcriptional repressor LexA